MPPAEPRANVSRVTLLIASLNAGGAERVLSSVANEWAAAGRQVSVLTLVDRDYPVFYALDPAIRAWPLGLEKPSANPIQGIRNNIRRLIVLRGSIAETKPDVVIVFGGRTAVLALIAMRGLGAPVIVSERHAPDRSIGRAWDRLRLLLYPRAAALVVATEGAKRHFPAAVQAICRVIPNPLVLPEVGAAPVARGDSRTVVAMGSLRGVKGFDKLIAAFARVAPQYPAWSLRIWGDGPLREKLQAQAAELGLADRVRLPGQTKQPFDELAKGDLFVSSSSSESFGNVLAEALAVGLPVISFDCNFGPREIIRDGVDGVLVSNGDVAALAAAMAQLMGDDAARLTLAARAPEVVGRLGLRHVMQLWEDLLIQVRGSKGEQ